MIEQMEIDVPFCWHKMGPPLGTIADVLQEICFWIFFYECETSLCGAEITGFRAKIGGLQHPNRSRVTIHISLR